jgi:hypothetical protein
LLPYTPTSISYKIGLLYVSQRLKGNSKEHYHLDALTRDARDDWVAAFKALRFNCIVALLQQNDPAVTAVFPFVTYIHFNFIKIDIDTEACIALCSALAGNSRVVELKQDFAGIECGAAVSQMLQRNSSLLRVELSGEIMLESSKG